MVEAEQVGMSSERLDRIGEVMRRLIDEKKIPGTVTLVARKGKVVHFEANGMRDVERNLPMEKDTIFRIYSQSKPLTGTAVMMLFEEGHFLLTDPIAKYLPEFSDMQVYMGESKGQVETKPAGNITIQQLATHTSGLTYSFMPNPVGIMYATSEIERGLGNSPTEESEFFVSNSKKEPFKNLQDWSESLTELPLLAQPGTQWNYSVGMDVLGRLIEVISGQSFGDFLNERIFDPLGMEDTGFYVPENKLDRFAANYFPSPKGIIGLMDDPQKSNYRNPPQLESGGGGLVSTVPDYLKFAQMLAEKGEFEGKRLLGRKTVEFMTSNHLGPEFPDDALTSLFGVLGSGYHVRGMGFGITGSVVSNSALSALPVSDGTYSWGGAATTHFWVDHTEDLVGLVHTQLLPDGTYPVRELMQLSTYQALID